MIKYTLYIYIVVFCRQHWCMNDCALEYCPGSADHCCVILNGEQMLRPMKLQFAVIHIPPCRSFLRNENMWLSMWYWFRVPGLHSSYLSYLESFSAFSSPSTALYVFLHLRGSTIQIIVFHQFLMKCNSIHFLPKLSRVKWFCWSINLMSLGVQSSPQNTDF